jgi:cellulose synthase/poly-beta-1,6-N-acetylglucosamine synthase-like glycosyltransferase
MSSIAIWLFVGAAALVLYTYLIYPLLLWLLSRVARPPAPRAEGWEWPYVSITVPAFNEEKQIGGLLDALLALDYPADRRQILVVSDASTDRTDEIVRGYADRGVELLRMPERQGKTAAESAARAALRGEIVVNTDASVRIDRGALKPLLTAFADPSVGLASGRDVSVSAHSHDANSGESGYVGYEMWVRSLETRVSGIVGASGCFYAIRSHLHDTSLPDNLSRDFAAALVTRENGSRAVSVDEAVCYVPRTRSLRREYRRKVRTMTRGMGTLYYKRSLLNPFRHPLFAWMLFSHKVCRWLIPWALALVVAAVLLLGATEPLARWASALLALAIAAGAVGWLASERLALPRPILFVTYLLTGNVAAMHAALRALRRNRDAIWEPTPREIVADAPTR